MVGDAEPVISSAFVYLAVVPANAGTHTHRLWNMGPRVRGDDNRATCKMSR
jgi:hypothetical protein